MFAAGLVAVGLTSGLFTFLASPGLASGDFTGEPVGEATGLDTGLATGVGLEAGVLAGVLFVGGPEQAPRIAVETARIVEKRIDLLIVFVSLSTHLLEVADESFTDPRPSAGRQSMQPD